MCHPFPLEERRIQQFRAKLAKNWPNYGEIPDGMYFEKKVLPSLKDGDWIKSFKLLPMQLSKLFVQAYQSKLFNDCLEVHIRNNYKFNKKRYALGELLMNRTPVEDVEIPVIGYDLKKLTYEVKQVLEKEEIEPREFKSRKFDFINSRSGSRDAFVRVENPVLERLQPDEMNQGKYKQVVRFTLKKGSYATMAIRAMEQ